MKFFVLKTFWTKLLYDQKSLRPKFFFKLQFFQPKIYLVKNVVRSKPFRGSTIFGFEICLDKLFWTTFFFNKNLFSPPIIKAFLTQNLFSQNCFGTIVFGPLISVYIFGLVEKWMFLLQLFFYLKPFRPQSLLFYQVLGTGVGHWRPSLIFFQWSHSTCGCWEQPSLPPAVGDRGAWQDRRIFLGPIPGDRGTQVKIIALL